MSHYFYPANASGKTKCVHRTYTCANVHFQSRISIFHTHTCTPGGIQVGVQGLQEGQYLSVVAVGYRERAEVCGGEGGHPTASNSSRVKGCNLVIKHTEYLK